MKARQAVATGGFAAACVACCAPPIIAALGVTAGLAATAGVFLGLAAAIVVVLIGTAWIARQIQRPRPQVQAGPVSLAAPPDAARRKPRSAPPDEPATLPLASVHGGETGDH